MEVENQEQSQDQIQEEEILEEENQEVTAEETKEPEGQNGEEETESAPDPDESEEMVITVGDEEVEPEESQAAPGWVKDVRKQNRELQREVRELRSRNQPEQKQAEAQLGPEPTLEAHDYDSEAYRDALLDWNEKKIKQNQAIEQQKKAQQKVQEDWNNTLKGYGDRKKQLKVSDFDDAEAVTQQHLHPVQLGIILQGADDPAKVIYAIGKDEKRAKAIAAITDPVKFAVAMAKLETTVKMKKRKPLPSPEKIPAGNSGKIQSADKKLESLMAEADKTGDRTKILAYKRELKRGQA
ncbi:hypothetical protein N9917_02405 [Deltaproteobacteria bacterium]|nr:hypothetical protein [Deltaproteobacteria bacterium]